MMTVLWSLLGLIVVVASVVLVYTATQPNDFRIARTLRIAATRETIFPLIDTLAAFNRWNPFAKQDATIAIAYSGAASGVGARSAWTSHGRAGTGSLEIVAVEPPSSVTMALRTDAPMQAINTIIFTLRPASAASTDVTWTMTGRYGFLGKLFGIICNMDRTVGGMFEKGLADLEIMAEQG